MVDHVSSCMDHNPIFYCILFFCKGVSHSQQVHKLGHIDNAYFFISYKCMHIRYLENFHVSLFAIYGHIFYVYMCYITSTPPITRLANRVLTFSFLDKRELALTISKVCWEAIFLFPNAKDSWEKVLGELFFFYIFSWFSLCWDMIIQLF